MPNQGGQKLAINTNPGSGASTWALPCDPGNHSRACDSAPPIPLLHRASPWTLDALARECGRSVPGKWAADRALSGAMGQVLGRGCQNARGNTEKRYNGGQLHFIFCCMKMTG